MGRVDVLELEMEEDVEDKTKCEKCLIGCRKTTTFLLSHVGLISLVISYCVLGALMFESLESRHELEVKNNMSNVRAEVSRYLWDMTKKAAYIEPLEWKRNASLRLQTFEADLIRLIKKGGWDGNESNTTQQWSFSGALFYSIVVITTIGYGHISPKTVWGKIVTIFYAILGIPLMLLCLSHIGDFMATAFRILYWKGCCYLCNRRVRVIRSPPMSRGRSFRGSSRYASSRVPRNRLTRTRSARASQRSAGSAHSDSVVANNTGQMFRRVQSHEDFRQAKTSSDRRRISPSPTRTTLKPYDNRPRIRSTKSAEPNIISIPSALPVLCNKYAEDIPETSFSPEREGRFQRRNITQISPIVLEPFQIEDYWEEYDDYSWEGDVGKKPVPIWLCVLLVFSYILGGAALFSKWENWPFLDSAYFCFVTLTTIGFGDFVPAQKVKVDVEVSIALCSLYLLFGISLLAMSFNLVQEQVISSIKQIASRLGIIRDEDEE